MGIATQNPKLRRRFEGKPEYVMNFMVFIARQLREYMAKLGLRTVDEMVGRTDLLKKKEHLSGRQSKVDLSCILAGAPNADRGDCVFDPTRAYDFKLEQTKDEAVLLKKQELRTAIASGTKWSGRIRLTNTDRTFGTLLGAEITRQNPEGLAEDTITIHCEGAGGQSFGAFLPGGLTLSLCGDSNDYFGKGLSGGKLAVYAPDKARFVPEENIIIGNVALYGATGGQAYIAGVAGERFCVRNSGAVAVVEGVGEHGCEYMTGGRVAVLGPTGKNFAAGMSGGIVYVLDEENRLYQNLNRGMVSMEKVESRFDREELMEMLQAHVKHTNSRKGREILERFDEYLPKFKKIIPGDYKRLTQMAAQFEEQGMSRQEAQIEAFYASIGGR